MTKVLVTGGVRSGKSLYAEMLLADAGPVSYITPGYPADPAADPEWAARVYSHQKRRPTHWRTVETLDIAHAVAEADTPVLIDCIGTWLSRSIDTWGTWDQPFDSWRHLFDDAVLELLDAWRNHDHPLVAVTNEVGWGLVSQYASGRLFADLTGRVNQRLATVCDEVVLMVAGRPLHL
ncbi:MAG: bifunctional adenosylcobinamide kinase/adenosylcobinamide-phosphate guanylyltransferase [Micropruina sp.]|uniref:bifunctional adenosylcobinamide kinase/adenosylcobinamide-phosphate guanylyltransferase n=1 Tax=Micropruina sp. TaxID=2737536 RepID=UPI0039E3AFC3